MANSADGDLAVPLTCPNCGWTERRPPRWFEDHAFYGCAKCRVMIEIDPGQREAARAYQGLLDALDAAFGRSV